MLSSMPLKKVPRIAQPGDHKTAMKEESSLRSPYGQPVKSCRLRRTCLVAPRQLLSGTRSHCSSDGGGRASCPQRYGVSRMTRTRLALLGGLVLFGQACTVGASAQEYRGTPGQQAACRPDVFRFCAGEIPNVRAITRCLERNMSRLTPGCQGVFAGSTR